jgi:hypothetical protein
VHRLVRRRGASCTITIVFNPTATGLRTATLTVLDNNFNSTQTVNLTGCGTSVTGPTPLSVDTTGLSCTSGVCTLGFVGDQLVKNFYFTDLTVLGQSCQHAPGSTTAGLTGPAIAGKTPSGQGIADQSQLTACGGFTVIRASVQNVSLPNGTVLWVTLGGDPIGRITLSNGAGTMTPWTLTISTLRKQAMGVFTQPPTGASPQSPLLSGPFV